MQPASKKKVVHEAAPDRDLPAIIRIDCTGLGGHDLGMAYLYSV